jgi:hypothetical protein
MLFSLKTDEMYFQHFYIKLRALKGFVHKCSSAKNAVYEKIDKVKYFS